MNAKSGEDVWEHVDHLIDRSPSVQDLRAHRLHLLAAKRFRAVGRPLPESLERDERRAAFVALAAGAVLERACSAVDQRVLAFKGIEVAASYPDPSTRPFGDVDLLVADAEAAQRELIEAGFRPAVATVGFYDDLHHLEPLIWPGLPLVIEVHRRPAWPEWLPEPRVQDLVDAAVPSRTGIIGLLAPCPSHHALLIAAHAWDFNPLGRLIDLIDVQVLARDAGREVVAKAAVGLGVSPLWAATLAASDAVLTSGAGHLPRAARNLLAARDSTVLGQHVRRWMSPFWILPGHAAVRATAVHMIRDLLPAGGETWESKMRRSVTAARNALRRKWTHDDQIGDASRLPPRRTNY